jgi:long-chain fatty acid transport protein
MKTITQMRNRVHSCERRGQIFVFVIVALSNSPSSNATADLFHYNNLLIGPRAIGLGGAFTALADDPSGLYYNPGGLAFQSSAQLSSSINTFYLRENSYEKVFGDRAFEDSARGTVSSFFGFSRKVNAPILGQMQVGLAFINPDAALSNENSLITDSSESDVVRYHRSANIRSGSSQISIGVAKRIGQETGAGCAVSYLDVDEMEQIYQDVVQGPFRFNELSNVDVFSTLGQNVRLHLVVRGVSARCGLRVNLGSKLRVGISYQETKPVFQNLEYDLELNKVFTSSDGSVISVENTDNTNLKGQLLRTVTRTKMDNFVQVWPNDIRLGFAYQPIKSLLISGDIVRHGDGDGSVAQVKRSEIINGALGAELTLANTLVLRGGLFTNRDATRTRDLASSMQRKEYIDYQGASLSSGFKLRSGEYMVHYTEQRGSGKAEKVTGNPQNSSGRMQVISISTNQSFQ